MGCEFQDHPVPVLYTTCSVHGLFTPCVAGACSFPHMWLYGPFPSFLVVSIRRPSETANHMLHRIACFRKHLDIQNVCEHTSLTIQHPAPAVRHDDLSLRVNAAPRAANRPQSSNQIGGSRPCGSQPCGSQWVESIIEPRGGMACITCLEHW